MTKLAVLFPGQGAQKVAMAKDFYEAYQPVRDIYERACEAIDYDLIQVSFEGPQEDLNKTDVCQPAILTASIAMLEALKHELKVKHLESSATAGLSLGEYTSLVYANSISLEEGVYLVRQRGLYMLDACGQFPSSMASVMGLDRTVCDEICQELAPTGIITVANINSPQQIVLSGELQPLEKACELAKERGARRVIPLAVSGAFHSECMAPAGKSLGEEIDRIDVKTAAIPVIANASAKANQDKDDLRQALKDQLTSSVEWVQSMQTLADLGVKKILELGPGRVISGLMKKNQPEMQAASINSISSMQKILSDCYLN